MRVDVEAAAHFGARLPRLAMLGMPVAEQGPAALPRAAAARRGAASRKGVQAVVDPALLSSELPAAEGGNALLHALTEFERLDQAAGLVAVYS